MSAAWQPNFDGYEPSLRQAVAAAQAFVKAAQDGEAGRWLTFGGIPGCGKTELASQTYLEARRFNPADRVGAWQTGTGIYTDRLRRPGSRFMTATEFANRCREDFSFPEQLGVEFLVGIDDVGATRDQTAFVAECLYRLGNARVGKFTLMTTNYSFPEVAQKIDERLASRMIRDPGSLFITIRAGDYGMRRNG